MPRRLTQEEFIQKAKELHGDAYDFSKVKYVNSKEDVIVICKKNGHGEFPIRAGRLITIRRERGATKPAGCPKCWAESKMWSEEDLHKESKKYQFRVEFQRESKGAYLAALRRGILDEVCAHMVRQLAAPGFWNYENCEAEARKYDARGKFMRGSASAYNASLTNGWLDEICKHMIKGADGYHYMVYGITNKSLRKAYVGVTKQHFNQRMKMHKKGGTTRADEIAKLEDTEFIELTGYTYTSDQLKSAEREWAEWLSESGFEILNDQRQYGRVGVSKRIYTDEIIAVEAKKYKTRGEFKANSPNHYDAACSQKLLNKVCAHMRAINPKDYWTKERCIEAARNYSNQDNFIKAEHSAYSSASRNGWLEELYSTTGLRAKNEMSWLRPATRKDLWCKADSYYEIWRQNGKCGMWRMRTITGENLDKMLKKFQKNWIPQKDADWQQWAEEVKRELGIARE
tara:strand:- start:1309 stop:2679 length:1371 start_codon:yes stop_codon:yes gene_type:complete